MDSSNLLSQLEQLDDEIDDLEESLEPLLKTALSETTSKLPLLDKAKLYVLITYAIESILFSYLRLHGVKAREHPVFTELTRVKQYFDKIKNVETPSRPPNISLDRGAAGRMIKHGLSGNDKYDTERAERIAKEKARSHIKFNELSKKRKVAESIEEEKESSSSESESESESEPELIGEDTVAEEIEGLEEVEVKVEEPKPMKEEKMAKRKSKSSGGDATPSISNTTSSDEKILKAQKRMKLKKEETFQYEKEAAVESAKRKTEKGKVEKPKRKKKRGKKSKRAEAS